MQKLQIHTGFFSNVGTKYKNYGNINQDRCSHFCVIDFQSDVARASIPSERVEFSHQKTNMPDKDGACEAFFQKGFGVEKQKTGSRYVFGAYDGHGIPGGEFAAQCCKDIFDETLFKMKRISEADLVIMFRKAHDTILAGYDTVLANHFQPTETKDSPSKLRTHRQLIKKLEFGTTAAVAILDYDEDGHLSLHIANSGDSEIVLGSSLRHSNDQSESSPEENLVSLPKRRKLSSGPQSLTTTSSKSEADVDDLCSCLCSGRSLSQDHFSSRARASTDRPVPERDWTASVLTELHAAENPKEVERIVKSGMIYKKNATASDFAFRTPPPQSRGITLTRSLGHNLFARYGVIPDPYIAPSMPLCPLHDRILVIASDGLWQAVGHNYQRVIQIAAEHYPNADDAAKAIGEATTHLYYTDNTVALVVFFVPDTDIPKSESNDSHSQQDLLQLL